MSRDKGEWGRQECEAEVIIKSAIIFLTQLVHADQDTPSKLVSFTRF